MSNLLNTTAGQSMYLFMTVVSNLCTKKHCCGVLIDNRADAPICVLEDKDRESKKKLAGALK